MVGTGQERSPAPPLLAAPQQPAWGRSRTPSSSGEGHGRLDRDRLQLLKAIKPVVEKGLASVNDQSPPGTNAYTALDEGADSNLEERLSHHVNGLQQVLTNLTKTTKALTRRYSQILEQIKLSEDQSSS